jgi:hypothetical protein
MKTGEMDSLAGPSAGRLMGTLSQEQASRMKNERKRRFNPFKSRITFGVRFLIGRSGIILQKL